MRFRVLELTSSSPASSACLTYLTLQVIVACARLFMGDRKIDKARELLRVSAPFGFCQQFGRHMVQSRCDPRPRSGRCVGALLQVRANPRQQGQHRCHFAASQESAASPWSVCFARQSCGVSSRVYRRTLAVRFEADGQLEFRGAQRAGIA